jgi:predicted O-methyltransferase YrrM
MALSIWTEPFLFGGVNLQNTKDFMMNELINLNPPALLETIINKTSESSFDMSSEPRTGAMLRMLAASKPNGRILELGTGTGISTAWLLDGMDDTSYLISVDNDKKFQNIAAEVLGNDSRLSLITEDGASFLQKQRSSSFDLIFADTYPGKYEVLDSALGLLAPGGLYIIDDMLPQANWPEGHAPKIPALISNLTSRENYRGVTLAWSSGLVILARMK